jgi:hypothetical protein
MSGNKLQRTDGKQWQQRQPIVSGGALEVGKDRSERNPNLLGNNLIVGSSKVNNSLVDKGDLMEGSSRALVKVPEAAESSLEIVSCVGREGYKADVDVTRSRVCQVENVTQCGSGPLVVDMDVGPNFKQHVALRTKKGDIPFVSKEGGANMNIEFKEGREVLGLCASEPLGLCPQQVSADSRSPLTEVVINSDIGNGGKCKRVTRRKKLPLPYNKFHKIHDQLHGKSGVATKRKSSKKVSETGRVEVAEESDPIQNSIEPIRVNYSDLEGIGLEVILTHDTEKLTTSSNSEVPCTLATRGGFSDSGLAELMGDAISLTDLPHNPRTLVDKDTGDAHHIIDIQEDIGMMFKGGKEDVVRCVRMEGRDRELKSNWEQRQGF